MIRGSVANTRMTASKYVGEIQMRRTIMAAGLSGLAACLAVAQTKTPAFDVASIRPSSPQLRDRVGGKEGITADPGTLMMSNVTLASSIRWAYGVQSFQVTGGPSWLNGERFDISAKASTPASESELRQMLQTLLAERFKVALHRESKQHAVYILSQAKNGTKCKESAGTGDVLIQPAQNGRGIVRQAPVARMVELLSQALQAPVIDETGLKGRYDCDIDVSPYAPQRAPEGQPQQPIDIVGLIQTGLQEQFGLKLESKKTVVEILVIDHAERTPTEN